MKLLECRILELRGNLHFMMGNQSDCLASHEEALQLAREVGSKEMEARALGGLADAHYATGCMIAGAKTCEECIALANAEGLGRVAVAYQPMLGLMKFFMLEVQEAAALSKESIATAQRLGYERAEVMARLIYAYVQTELLDNDGCLATLDPCGPIIEKLGLESFAPEIAQHRADPLVDQGQAELAISELTEACDLARSTRPHYSLPSVIGRLALATKDTVLRESCLEEGLAQLQKGALSHNHFDFYRYALECYLDDQRWDKVEETAKRLESYPEEEAVPWSRFFASRARILARIARGERDEDLLEALKALQNEAAEKSVLLGKEQIDRTLESLW